MPVADPARAGHPPRTPLAELGRGRSVVAASAAGFALGLSGLPFYTIGVFAAPLAGALRWPHSKIQAGLAAVMLVSMVSQPLVGRLVDRFGPRPVAIASISAFSLAFMALGALAGTPGTYLPAWALVAVCGAGTLPLVWARMITTWFGAARGAALGLAMTGTGLTAIIAPVLAELLIERIGWRLAFVALGALPLTFSLPVAVAWFRPPPARGSEAEPAWNGPQVSASAGGPAFLAIGLAFLLIGGSVAGLVPNLVTLLRADGLRPIEAARTASFLGLFVICGRLGCGVLLDRFWPPAVGAFVFALAAAGCVTLAHGAGWAAIAAGAASLGFAAGAEFDVMPFLAARYFGDRALGVSLGGLSAFFYLGSAVGPWGVGRIAEASGGFRLPLELAAGAFLTGALLLLSLAVLGAGRRHPAQPFEKTVRSA